LCQKAACQYWNRDFRNAARNISKAFELNPKSVPVLRVLSLVLEMEAVEKSAEAAALRRPTYAGSNEQRFGDYIYTYTRWIRPSNAELQQAALLAEQSKKLREEALERLLQASSIVQEPGRKHQLLGLYHWYRGDLEKASIEYEAAVTLEPTQSQWHFNLAAIYDALGRTTDAFEQRVISINSMDTSADPLLAASWDLFARTKFRSVRQVLVRCADIDPSDPRTAAYLGIAQLHDGNSREAVSWLELAVALESARLKHHGIEMSVLPDTSVSFSIQKRDHANTSRLNPSELGFTLGASLRLAQAYRQAGKHDRSALLAQQLLRHEHRVLFTDKSTDVIEAILPDPGGDLHAPPRREHTSSLFAWLRVAGGEALYHQGKYQQAIEFLQPTQRVEGELQNGRGEERLIGPMLYGAVVLARSYLELGDLENATQYVNLVP
jgi:tetratricopeptide (TPR) repeat protein